MSQLGKRPGKRSRRTRAFFFLSFFFVAIDRTLELNRFYGAIESCNRTQETKMLNLKTRKSAKSTKVETAPETTTVPTVSEAIAVIVAATEERQIPSWGDFKNPDAAPVEIAPDLPETAAAILSIAATAPKAKKAATGTAAARKAALAAEGDKAGRLERVIALLSRPEGASLQDIQTCYWLAAAAVRRIVEKAGYTTTQSGDRGSYRYHARKA
jgi:hypothetical protein